MDKIAKNIANYEIWIDIRKLFKTFTVGDVMFKTFVVGDVILLACSTDPF